MVFVFLFLTYFTKEDIQTTGDFESSLLQPEGKPIHVRSGRSCCFHSALGCSIGLFSSSEIYCLPPEIWVCWTWEKRERV